MRSSIRRRRAIPLLLLAAIAVAVDNLPTISSAGPADLTSRACAVPKIELVRTLRGYRADRSGDIQLFTQEPNYVGSGLPHVAPFDYVEDVPMFWYGPGYIKAQGSVSRPVVTPDIAPTEATLLGFHRYTFPDSQPLSDALLPGTQRSEPPRLIITYVWDAGGDVVLNRWPKAWPYLKSLIPKGTWYENATIGSAPASTAQIHSEMGTGAWPKDHGVVGHHFRIGEAPAEPWRSVATMPILPTLADLYDRDMGNRPKVATLATVAIHNGMASHGSVWGGGDKDIAVLREPNDARTLGNETGVEWTLTRALAPYFTLPSYANDLPLISSYFGFADRMDGKQDGKWRGWSLDLGDEQSLGGFDTPARIPYQQRLVEEVIKREGFGQDATPDLLFINNKLIDTLGHIGRGLDSPRMGDAVRAQDLYLRTFIRFLDDQVGANNWVMVLTADHGATPFPGVSGAFVISPGKVGQAIEARFDSDDDTINVLQFVQPTQVFLDTQELSDNGFTLADVSRYLLTLTEQQTFQDAPPPRSDANAKVFTAALPSDDLARLPCLTG
jgi:hypothetical protein